MASKTLLCLDKTGFRRKPTKNQTAKISARIASNQIELDLQDENDLDAFIEKITTKDTHSHPQSTVRVRMVAIPAPTTRGQVNSFLFWT